MGLTAHVMLAYPLTYTFPKEKHTHIMTEMDNSNAKIFSQNSHSKILAMSVRVMDIN